MDCASTWRRGPWQQMQQHGEGSSSNNSSNSSSTPGLSNSEAGGAFVSKQQQQQHAGPVTTTAPQQLAVACIHVRRCQWQPWHQKGTHTAHLALVQGLGLFAVLHMVGLRRPWSVVGRGFGHWEGVHRGRGGGGLVPGWGAGGGKSRAGSSRVHGPVMCCLG
jgi:hypothetical protein